MQPPGESSYFADFFYVVHNDLANQSTSVTASECFKQCG